MNLKHAYYRAFQKVFKVAMCFLPWAPPQLMTGPGSVKELATLVKSKGIKKVLIVTDKGLMSLNLLDSLFGALESNGVEYVVYDEVQPNPTIPNIESARKLYVDNNCEGIIAFGGGSPMDCAKVAGARVVRPNKSIPKMRGIMQVMKPIPPFFAVPTTAGTGSETTLAAVVSNPDTHEKYPINDPVLRPKYAVLDPELTVGLPPHITSTTGMDALTHAVEAYIGRSGVKSTDENALKATKMIFENIFTAYSEGKDLKARENMLLASFYAGAAFTRAYVGYVHSIAHNLGGMYGIPHGLANAIILPYVLDWYGESAHKKLAELSKVAKTDAGCTTDAQKANAFIAAIRDLNAKMNIPDKIDGIQEKDIPTIAQRALKEANPLYPVPKIMDQADVEFVIRKLMK